MSEGKVDRYELIERIGKGGMGDVYLARLARFRRSCVIKFLLPECVEHLDLFKAEATLGARFIHGNVVGVIDFFEEKQRHYLVMEYVEGVDLRLLLEKQIQLAPELAVLIMVQVLRGLKYVHDAFVGGRHAAIVHRDLNPPNILISCDGEAKITDFGVAKASVDFRQKTEAYRVAGKQSYFPPEMLKGVELDGRADIYTCGLVLYEMLAGHKAYPTSASQMNDFVRIVEGSAEPIQQAAPTTPAALAQVVAQMMSADRELRHANAWDACDALMRAVPDFMFAYRELARVVRRLSARQRRRTSAWYRDHEAGQAPLGPPPGLPAVLLTAPPEA